MATVYGLEDAIKRACERATQDDDRYIVYEHRTNKGDFMVKNWAASPPRNFVRVYEALGESQRIMRMALEASKHLDR